MSILGRVTATRIRERVATGLVLGGLTGSAGCAPDEATPTAGPEVLREGVDMVIVDMDHYLSRLGIRRARLLADTAEYVSENEIHLKPVELVFFDDEGREISVLIADYGVFDEVSEDMEANGNVVVLDRRDDRKLETEQIRYTKEEDRLYGDSPFVMESNGGRTIHQGDSFEADPGLDDVIMWGPGGRSEPRIDTLTVEPLDSGADATPDSLLEVDPDSPAAEAPDSLAAEAPDSLAAETPDSLAARDSTSADSTATARDTAARDTTSRDTTTVAPDSTARDMAGRDTTAHRSTTSVRRREQAGRDAG